MQSDYKHQAPNFFHLHLILVTKDYQNVVYLSLKPQPNDHSISTQHIPTLLAQHLQAPVKQSQHLNATDHNIVESNMLYAFGHHVATCCDIELVRNRHAQAQHCCTNLAK